VFGKAAAARTVKSETKNNLASGFAVLAIGLCSARGVDVCRVAKPIRSHIN
jgi:hypothetical protein